MSDAATTTLRAAAITRLQADAGVQATAMGSSPRVFNRVRGNPKFPYIVLTVTEQPWDTTGDRGSELELMLHVLGEYQGDAEGEAILAASLRCLRDWAPQALSDHRLVTLICKHTSRIHPEEDGKRYFGAQRWRATMEES